jgi:hypothetical protein
MCLAWTSKKYKFTCQGHQKYKWRKDSVSKKLCWGKDNHIQKNENTPYVSTAIKIKSKQFKDLKKD